MGDKIYMPPRPEGDHLYVTPPRFERPAPPCRDPEHEEEFFGPDGREPYHENRRREHRARRLCQGCPFFVECAAHALEHEEFGVWGGLAEGDRVALGGVGRRRSGPNVTRTKVVERLATAGFTLSQIRALLDAAAEVDDREGAA